MTVDITAFGAQAPLAEMYLAAVDAIARIDEQMGNATSTSSLMENLKEQYPHAVEVANKLIEQIESEDDEVAKVVTAYVVIRHRPLGTLVNEYIRNNQPKDEAPKVDADTIARLYEDRKENVLVAQNMYSTLEVLHKNKPEFGELPEKPKGIRGGAPGKRATMGRKVATNIDWTIAGEHIGSNKKTLDLAKLVGLTSAGAFRKALQEAYPDALPSEFSTKINGRDVAGKTVGSTPVVEEDDDDDDVADEPFNFDEDDTE
jgi:hypothetical protein